MTNIIKRAVTYSAIIVIAAMIGTVGVAGCKATVESPGPAVEGPAGAPGAAGAAGAKGETGSQGAPAAATKSSESSTTTQTNSNPDTGSSTTTEKSSIQKSTN
jgi:hypothetical protein